MVFPVPHEVELAEAIDATILSGADGITLGPSDAALASAALRALAGLPLDVRLKALAGYSDRWKAPERVD